MTHIAIAYHSPRGHTARVAHAVAEGVRGVTGCTVHLVNIDGLDEAGWATLDAADAIIFGSPTYMGGVSAKFKEFIDSASRRWHNQLWKNKIAAGFTNSGAYCGDKFNALTQLVVNAMQHSMIWVGTGILPPSTKGLAHGQGPGPEAINRLGSCLGVMTQSNDEPVEFSPPSGDLETARLFGHRVAVITVQFKAGAA